MKTIVGFASIAVLLLVSVAWAKVGGGDIVYPVNKAGDVLFSHDAHMTKHGLKCTSCHYRLYTMTKGHSSATKADMERGESCGACHNGEQVFGVKGNCNRCHIR